MKKALVLANLFPFSEIEQYMETEEKYYKRFDKVWIASLGLSETALRKKRKLQSKADVIPVLDKSMRYYRFNCITILTDRNLYKELLELKKAHRLTRQHINYLLYYISKSHYTARVIDKALKNEDKNDLLIYAYRFEFQSYVALLLRKKWGYKSKIVCRAHGYDLYEERNALNYIPMRRVILNEADYVFPCSQCGVEYIKNRYSIGKTCVDVRYLGTVDHGEKEFISSRETLSILSCSYVLEVKRLDRIVDALSLIKDIPIEWIHYGDGILLDELRKYADNNLNSNVRVSFAGNIPNSELMQKYASRDFCVFLNVSSSEGLPVSIMEAMSFGIPCIATDVGGTKEIVDNDHGFLISKDAGAEEISEAIRALYSMNENDYRALRHRARAFWEAHFDAENNYNDFINELVSLK